MIDIWDQYKYVTDLTTPEQMAVSQCVQTRAAISPLIYIEIGVFMGGTFKAILEQTKNQNVHCWGLDLFEDQVDCDTNTHISGTCHKQVLEDDLKQCGYKHFDLIKGDSIDTLLGMKPIPNGVIFIDGNHTYKATMLDFLLANFIIQHGYFIFHNSTNTHQPDIQYVQRDGGPYLVIQHILQQTNLEFIGLFDRNTVLKKS